MLADLVLATLGLTTPEAILLSAWPVGHAVALKRLVIPNVLLELAERVASRGAVGSSTHEGHGSDVGSESKCREERKRKMQRS